MINWNEASTKRGLVWIIAGVIGVIFSYLGKDPMLIMSIAGAVAGGMGLVMPDKAQP